jgi:hypothetical protein
VDFGPVWGRSLPKIAIFSDQPGRILNLSATEIGSNEMDLSYTYCMPRFYPCVSRKFLTIEIRSLPGHAVMRLGAHSDDANRRPRAASELTLPPVAELAESPAHSCPMIDASANGGNSRCTIEAHGADGVH